MARTKSKTEQAKVAVTRLVQDEDVQKQLRTAAVRLREAWSRASGRPASKAIGDKKLYLKVRDAASSLVAAGRSLVKKPTQPKRTGRKVIAGAALAGGAAYAVTKKRSSGATAPSPYSADPAGPVAAPTPPTPVNAS
jgi:hypothetical protein